MHCCFLLLLALPLQQESNHDSDPRKLHFQADHTQGNAIAHTGDPSIQGAEAETRRLWVLGQPGLFIKICFPIYEKEEEKERTLIQILYGGTGVL